LNKLRSLWSIIIQFQGGNRTVPLHQVQVELIAQINEMMIEWRNEGKNALDYNEQKANEDGDQNMDRVIKENLGRAQIVVSNRY